MNAGYRIPIKEIESFCHRWRVTELALFGSVTRDDFDENSDVDVLVTFEPENRYTLFDLVHMQEELRGIFGMEVDLVEKAAIERSRNPLRRKAILDSAEIVYAA